MYKFINQSEGIEASYVDEHIYKYPYGSRADNAFYFYEGYPLNLANYLK